MSDKLTTPVCCRPGERVGFPVFLVTLTLRAWPHALQHLGLLAVPATLAIVLIPGGSIKLPYAYLALMQLLGRRLVHRHGRTEFVMIIARPDRL